MAAYELLIVDELGYVPLSKTGAELLFEAFSQRYERTSTLVTRNLPFDERTEIFGSSEPHRRTPRPHHPPRPHPGDERRLLPPQAKPSQTSLQDPPKRASGEQGGLCYDSGAPPPPKYPFPILYWLPFTPPQRSTFTPPLTRGAMNSTRMTSFVPGIGF